MPIWDIYSKRAKQLPDVYQFETLPGPLRVSDDELAVVIAGTREDWPGGTRTLTPRAPTWKPSGRTLWFGAELAPAGSQVWFRITAAAVGRMREKTPRGRGDRLIDTLLAWPGWRRS